MTGIKRLLREVLTACTLVGLTTLPVRAENPIVQGQGLCDPDIRIYDGRAYLYGTHDADPAAKNFTMNDWWVWSSDDLVTWKKESALTPEQTYYGKPNASCWATTAARRNDRYFFYFSRGRDEIGVVTGPSPIGPWTDPLGKPMLTKFSTPKRTAARDPVVFQEADGTSYIVFGVYDFYIAKLNDDMISLAEPPRPIDVQNPVGPAGKGKTDDKPFLHRHGDKYYLSWGCFYAMGDSPYGPFVYADNVLRPEHTDPLFTKDLNIDRHGCFFEFKGRWYFACNDRSFPGLNKYFRETIIGEVHYRNDGTIEPIDMTRKGVTAGGPATKPAS